MKQDRLDDLKGKLNLENICAYVNAEPGGNSRVTLGELTGHIAAVESELATAKAEMSIMREDLREALDMDGAMRIRDWEEREKALRALVTKDFAGTLAEYVHDQIEMHDALKAHFQAEHDRKTRADEAQWWDTPHTAMERAKRLIDLNSKRSPDVPE